MKKFVTSLMITALITFSINAKAIANANANNRVPSGKPGKSFIVSSKSKTIEMAKGQTYRLKMTLRTNRYYFVSVNGKKNLGNIQYKIIDPSNNNTVIFDNSAHEFENNMTFHNNIEREIIIEIKTLPCCPGNSKSQKSNVKLLFANKKSGKNDNANLDDYNLYAVL